jgi:hypothetical protein
MRRTAVTGALIALSFFACKKSIPLTPEPPEWLDAEVKKLGEQSAPGTTMEGDLYRGSSPQEGLGQKFNLSLESGKCYHMAAVGDQNIREMSLYLWDTTGWRAETERGRTSKTVLMHCPEKTGMHEFEVKPTGGNGHFAFGIFSKDAPTPDPEPVAPPEPAGMDLAALIEKEAKSSAPGAERVGDFFKDSSDKRDWFTALEKGYCYWWIGAADPEQIDELTLYLWDSNDERITQSKSQSNIVTIGHCPDKSGMHKFQAAIGSGDGTYMVGLYKKAK